MSLAAPLEKPDFRRSCLTVATREVSTRGRLGGGDRCGAGERRRPTEAEREVDASAVAVDPRTSPCPPREELPESSNSCETAVLVTEPSRAEQRVETRTRPGCPKGAETHPREPPGHPGLGSSRPVAER